MKLTNRRVEDNNACDYNGAMTLAMDGVRRISTMQPTASVAALPMAPQRPINTSRAAALATPAAGVRYVTGIDGIRRPTAMPTPREVVASLTAPAAAPIITPTEPEAAAALTGARPWLARPAIAFSLVATALVASGAAAAAVTTHRAATPAKAAATAQAAKSAPAPSQAPAAPAVVAPTPDPRQASLQQLLNQFVATNTGGSYNIMVKDLKTGLTASINPDQSYMSASLYKLFVAQQIYRQIDTGQLTYGTNAGGGSGNNISGCLNLMITVSDNACGRALGSILNWQAQDTALANAGYTETSLDSPQRTSARDVGMLFERLYNGTLNSPSSNDAFMNLLKSQRVNNRLPVGLPAGTLMAHKTGDLDDVVHDAGIVYGPKTDYLVVVMSGQWKTPGKAPAQFAQLSTQLWNFFEQ